MAEQVVVVTKHSDFVDSLVLTGVPWKLLLVATGNIDNRTLDRLLVDNLTALASALEIHTFVEISETTIRVHF